MFIAKYNNVDLHWWGDSLLLIHNISEYYILEKVETFFIEHLRKENEINRLIETISDELICEPATVKTFIDTFLRNFSDYFFLSAESTFIKISGKKFAYYPLELHISLTNRCVQHCMHCYKSASPTGLDIDYKNLTSFLDQMVEYVPYLCLSGGEPTLHPLFRQIIEKYSFLFSICVLTSGVHILPFLDTITKAKRGLVVSIYSSNPQIHDEFTGYAGSFLEIERLISSALSKQIPVGVTTFLSENNSLDIENLIQSLTFKGVNFITVGKITPIGRAKENGLPLSNKTRKHLQEEMLRLKGIYKSVEFLTDSSCLPSILSFSPLKCSAGTLSWAIFENGQIQPCGICSFDEISMGTIDAFDKTILNDRTPYINKINNCEKIRHMYNSGEMCLFTDE